MPARPAPHSRNHPADRKSETHSEALIPSHVFEDLDCVLAGAGISFSPPASLPSGDALAHVAWEWMLGSQDDLSETLRERSFAALQGDSRYQSGLRLEQLMEVLRAVVSAPALYAPYELLRDASPNFVHEQLAHLDVPVVTVNIDELLESAGCAIVEHLHGRISDPASIVTTISQYSSGLGRESVARLEAVMADQRVLVVGYSGRDRDVLPAVVDAKPKRVTWIVYPGEKLAPEVVDAHARLSRQGSEVTVYEVDIADELWAHFGAAETQELYKASRVKAPMRTELPPDAAQLLSTYPLPKRRLAIALVLFELGLYSESQQMARASLRGPALRAQRSSEDEKRLARKVIARGHRRTGHPYRAVARLVTPPTRGSLSANANELATALAQTAVPASADALDRLIISRASSSAVDSHVRAGRRAAIRLLQREVARGNSREALDEVNESRLLAGRLDLGNLLDERTWLADAHRSVGEYEAASLLLRQGDEDRPYADFSQQAYFFATSIALTLARGEPTGGSVSGVSAGDLDELLHLGERAGLRGPEHALAATLRAVGQEFLGNQQARSDLEALRPWASRLDNPVRDFYLLQCAQQAWRAGDTRAANTDLTSVRARKRARRAANWLASSAANAISAAMRLELDAGDEAAARELETLAAAYSQRQLGPACAWVEANLHRLGARNMSGAALEALRAQSWHYEANFALLPRGEQPLPWIMCT